MSKPQLSQDEQLSPTDKLPRSNQSNIFIISFIISIIVLSSAAYLFTRTKLSPKSPPIITGVDLNKPPEGSTLNIQYSKKEKILEALKIPGSSATTEDDIKRDFDVYEIEFYKIGNILSGKYKGGELVLVSIIHRGMCKSSSCGKPLRLRYIMVGKKTVYLPKISAPHEDYKSIGPYNPNFNPFQKFGLSLIVDDNLTIPALEYPKKITGASPRQIMEFPKYNMEEEGKIDDEKIYPVFTHKIFGQIYTTNPELSPGKSFDYAGGGLGAKNTVEGCRGEDCFTTNAFFAFRPDGTFLKYIYRPDFSEKDILWNDQSDINDKYDYTTHTGCSDDRLDYNSIVVQTLVNENDLEILGRVRSTDDFIYGLRDRNHKLYVEFYQNYQENFSAEKYPANEKEKAKLRSFDEFIASLPIFFWRDPFGRLIRFNNTDFLPPFFCEPVIYLYPKIKQEVSVSIKPKGGITDSSPAYNKRWEVIADLSGKITNLSDSKTYPYLFWEGWSSIFPRSENGFVVEKSKVPTFLKETLSELGLNEKETKDFLNAWLPSFSDAPYYFITFIDQKVIDDLVPLTVSPQPDAVIRILVDFKPLDQPIVVPQLKLSGPPKRQGFTVVEWGGLKR